MTSPPTIQVDQAKILQIIPAPAGCLSRRDDEEIYAFALCELVCRFPDEVDTWTGCEILPVGSDLTVIIPPGTTGSLFYQLHALGDYAMRSDLEIGVQP